MPDSRTRRTSTTFVAVQLALFACYFAVPSWRLAWKPSTPWRLPALMLLVAGSALSTAGMWTIRRHLTPFPYPLPETRLVTSGPFAVSRHPIYTGLLAAALGWAAWEWDLSKVTVTVVLGLLFEWKARFEERLLAERYPGEYASYARKVKRLMPW